MASLAVELNPIADVERALDLHSEPGEQVAERLLEREPDDRRQERARREDLPGLDAHRAQDREEDDEVDDALDDVADDFRDRGLQPRMDDDVEDEQHRRAPERGEQRAERDEVDEFSEVGLGVDEVERRPKDDVRTDVEVGLSEQLSIRRGKEQPNREHENDRDTEPDRLPPGVLQREEEVVHRNHDDRWARGL